MPTNTKYPAPKPCRHRTKQPKVRGLCPKCYAKWLRKNNPKFYKRGLKKSAQYYQKHKKKLLAANSIRRNALPKNKRKDADLRAKLGLPPGEYQRKARRQKHRCMICGKKNQRRTRLHVDHDHDSGQIRDLLCFHCNAGLGHFFDSPRLLLKALLYLKRWTEKKNGKH